MRRAVGGGGDEPPFGGDGPVVGDVIVGGWHASLGRTGRQARRAGAERSVGMRTVERQWRRDSDGDTNEREPGSTQCGRRRRRRGGDVPKTIKNKNRRGPGEDFKALSSNAEYKLRSFELAISAFKVRRDHHYTTGPLECCGTKIFYLLYTPFIQDQSRACS